MIKNKNLLIGLQSSLKEGPKDLIEDISFSPFEPPMRIELMTFALRERRSTD